MKTDYIHSNGELKQILIEERDWHGRFKKGSTPWNKGTKGKQTGGKKTQFKKGSEPHNTKYDGCISIRKDKSGWSYKYIRISKGNWKPLHRHIWEQHNGEIPKNHCVIFRDSDPMNCDIENLQIISRKENMNRNRNRKKAAKTQKELWRMERLRQRLGLKRKSKLRL